MAVREKTLRRALAVVFAALAVPALIAFAQGLFATHPTARTDAWRDLRMALLWPAIGVAMLVAARHASLADKRGRDEPPRILERMELLPPLDRRMLVALPAMGALALLWVFTPRVLASAFERTPGTTSGLAVGAFLLVVAAIATALRHADAPRGDAPPIVALLVARTSLAVLAILAFLDIGSHEHAMRVGSGRAGFAAAGLGAGFAFAGAAQGVLLLGDLVSGNYTFLDQRLDARPHAPWTALAVAVLSLGAMAAAFAVGAGVGAAGAAGVGVAYAASFAIPSHARPDAIS